MSFSRGSTSATYRYDGTGLRVAKSVNGVNEAFVWDQSGTLPLLLQDGNTSYLYGPGNSPIESIAGSQVRYLHHDQLGSVRSITDVAGQVTGTASFDVYGNRTSVAGEQTPFGYGGEYTDAEGGLLYLRARLYDPGTGQFLSRDALDSQTRAAYSYAGGDPINATDPSGLSGGSGGGGGLPDLPRRRQMAAFGGSGSIPELAPRPDGGPAAAAGGLPDLCPTAPNDGQVADDGQAEDWNYGSDKLNVYVPPSPDAGRSTFNYVPPPAAGQGSGSDSGGGPAYVYPDGGRFTDEYDRPRTWTPPPTPTSDSGQVADGSFGGAGGLPDLYPPPPPQAGGPVAESGSLATGGAV